MIVAGEDDRLYMGGDPGVLFESADGGASWALERSLWDHPTRPDWQPGGGGLCLHSIVPWPGEPERLALAMSAVGVWLTDDGGATWRHGNEGLRPRYLPEDAEPGMTLCVHDLHRAPKRPERMFMQFHGGVYRSDDAGASWTDIGAGLPSDFGFPMVLDPADPDSAYVIPLEADMDRVTPDGRVRVYETRDAGATWTPRGDGLPGEHAYLTILRQAFDRAGEGDALRAVLRHHVGRRVRLGRRGRELVGRGRAPPAGLLGQDGVTSCWIAQPLPSGSAKNTNRPQGNSCTSLTSTPRPASSRRAASASATTICRPCTDPGSASVIPVPIEIEHADPGGVSCTNRSSSLTRWSWSAANPTCST